MEGLRMLLWVASGLFAALTAFAALVQMRDSRFTAPCLLILAGCFALGVAVYGSLGGYDNMWTAALTGSLAISAGAMWNGRRNGNFHIKHHIFRWVLCALFVAGYAFL